MKVSVSSLKVLSLLGLLSFAGAGAGVAHHRYWPRAPVLEGLSIGDRRAPDGAPGVVAWLWARREAALQRSVRFRHEQQLFESTLGEAGVTIDVEATLAQAEAVGQSGTVIRRLREAARARRGEIDIPLVWKVDEAKARALLATYASSVYQAPVDARIDLTQHARYPDEPGRELDVDASLAELTRGTHDEDEVLSLITRRVRAKVTSEQLTSVDIEKVVAAYETTFSLFGTGANRAVNIKNAARRMDGTILAPGAVFSFNDVVGPRSRERGFALAPEIQGDEMQLGYGGGTCQASSTLYAAALFGALEIVERLPHSRPSSYMLMGLDATVSYPLADLKIRNPLPFPVMIHAFSPKPNMVRVEILGGDPIAKVEYAYGVGQTEDFVRRVQVKPGLAPGKRVLHQKGIRGFDVTSIVRVHYFNGREDQRTYYSGYRPAPEIYWVAPGYDVAELPPLPEHAKGVEGLVGG
ncbi:Vancomycin B-type resistance protein VanW [Minicystis rosea]|nr:Vancomycin B-type resistance protein VanW [Minicystis rosea]